MEQHGVHACLACKQHVGEHNVGQMSHSLVYVCVGTVTIVSDIDARLCTPDYLDGAVSSIGLVES